MIRRNHSERSLLGNVFTAVSMLAGTLTYNLPVIAASAFGLKGFRFSSLGLGLGIVILLASNEINILYHSSIAIKPSNKPCFIIRQPVIKGL